MSNAENTGQRLTGGCHRRDSLRLGRAYQDKEFTDRHLFRLFVTFEGVVKYIQMLQEKDASATAQKWADQFAKTAVCPECHGAKLNKEALSFRIHDKNIYELSTMDINEL